jgi:hypothetical protein
MWIIKIIKFNTISKCINLGTPSYWTAIIIYLFKVGKREKERAAIIDQSPDEDDGMDMSK